ncbi:hypothetical protein [Saccharopolyspora hattusasensis]|uniref:hypothetical protein n=1 Tax=Saccharopolyspora hattusasensis TaxID=1128679 RepID=UPI003D95CB71
MFGEPPAGAESQAAVDGFAVRGCLQDRDAVVTAARRVERGEGDGTAVAASAVGGQRADVVDR